MNALWLQEHYLGSMRPCPCRGKRTDDSAKGTTESCVLGEGHLQGHTSATIQVWVHEGVDVEMSVSVLCCSFGGCLLLGADIVNLPLFCSVKGATGRRFPVYCQKGTKELIRHLTATCCTARRARRAKQGAGRRPLTGNCSLIIC